VNQHPGPPALDFPPEPPPQVECSRTARLCPCELPTRDRPARSKNRPPASPFCPPAISLSRPWPAGPPETCALETRPGRGEAAHTVPPASAYLAMHVAASSHHLWPVATRRRDGGRSNGRCGLIMDRAQILIVETRIRGGRRPESWNSGTIAPLRAPPPFSRRSLSRSLSARHTHTLRTCARALARSHLHTRSVSAAALLPHEQSVPCFEALAASFVAAVGGGPWLETISRAAAERVRCKQPLHRDSQTSLSQRARPVAARRANSNTCWGRLPGTLRRPLWLQEGYRMATEGRQRGSRVARRRPRSSRARFPLRAMTSLLFGRAARARPFSFTQRPRSGSAPLVTARHRSSRLVTRS
jgi:hypothetical protein